MNGRALAFALLVGVGGLAAAAPAATARGVTCLAGMASVKGEYCIDRYEASADVVDARGRTLRKHSPYHTQKPAERLAARSRRGVVPQAYLSQVEAAAACENAGKRLCTDQEWLTACKGKSPTLYPYGDERVDGRCNDAGVSPLRLLHGADDSLSTFGMDAMNDPRLNQVKGSVARTGRFSRCRSSYGTYDMVGNLHEWTANPGGAFRGGYYLDNHLNGDGCGYLTTAHDTKYHDYSIGFRCCRGGAGDALVKRQRPKKQGGTAAPRVHVVERGDTLSGLARKYDLTVSTLCEENGIVPRDPLRIGQELKIPAK